MTGKTKRTLIGVIIALNLLANIYAGLPQRLRYFNEPTLCRITERSDIDLTLLAKEKCAYFVSMDDTQNTYQFLTATFFDFLFKDLKNYADSRVDRKCPIPVNVLMDEFANLGALPHFDQVLTVARSRNIRISPVKESN